MEAVNRFGAAVILAVAAVIAAYFFGRTEGARATNAKLQTTLAAINTEHTRQLAIATQAARDDERRRVQAQDFIDRNLFKELADEKRKTASLIDSVNAGTLQLRQRFTCPASTSGDVPSIATSTSPGDAATPGGLQTADAIFLVSIADEADQLAHQLTACQAIISNDRSN